MMDKSTLEKSVNDFYHQRVNSWFCVYKISSNILTGMVVVGGVISAFFGLFGDSKTKYWLFEPKIWAGVGGVLVTLGNTSKGGFKIEDNEKYYRYFNNEADAIRLQIPNADEPKLEELNDKFNELVEKLAEDKDDFIKKSKTK